eukprot:8596541-Pyramimonas_sp.AAC.1
MPPSGRRGRRRKGNGPDVGGGDVRANAVESGEGDGVGGVDDTLVGVPLLLELGKLAENLTEAAARQAG